MPIYEYKCDDCGNVSEVLVRNTREQTPVVCVSCRSVNVSRLISAPGAVRVKGGASPQGAPPISCPHQTKCQMPHDSCPAAKMHRH